MLFTNYTKQQHLETLLGILVANLKIVDWKTFENHKNKFCLKEFWHAFPHDYVPKYHFFQDLWDAKHDWPKDDKIKHVFHYHETKQWLQSLIQTVEKKENFDQFLRLIKAVNKIEAMKKMINNNNNNDNNDINSNGTGDIDVDSKNKQTDYIAADNINIVKYHLSA